MQLIRASAVVISVSHSDPLYYIARCARVCYQSTNAQNTDDTSFIKMLLSRGHMTPFEHVTVSVQFIVDRGLSHEIVRHRLISFNQESTRYCNYTNKEIRFVIPSWVKLTAENKPCDGRSRAWYEAMMASSVAYKYLIAMNCTPQQARDVLPNALKTELIATANLREWMHFFTLRCAPTAHPEMQRIAIQLLENIVIRVPVVFDELAKQYGVYHEDHNPTPARSS